MQAKRRAVDSLVRKSTPVERTLMPVPNVVAKESAKVDVLN